MSRRVLVVRADNAGDVVLTGPAVRAVAREARVSFLAGPHGAAAAALLPGVDRVLVHELPWIAADPPPVRRRALRRFVRDARRVHADEAIVFTSFHQSPLPAALLLRQAGLRRVSAVSIDYPGSLLDVRHHVPDDIHEVERNLSLVRAAGYTSTDPLGDELRLRDVDRTSPIEPPYVVVHPGASARARTWPAARFAATVRALADRDVRVVVTGSPAERPLTSAIGSAVAGVTDLAGRTDLPTMVAVIRDASCIVVGNTGPAHLAAACGTPVVSLYPPTLPAARWRPWKVPHVLLGNQDAECAGCRARECPVGQHCLAGISVTDVVDAVDTLSSVWSIPAHVGRPAGVRP